MDRVKYGVLNIVGDPHGVRCCYSYGDSFLQVYLAIIYYNLSVKHAYLAS